MRLRDEYDWLVLGDSIGALLNAGIVAKLGLSVLVLSLNPGARAKVSNSGQLHDPESNFLLGLGQYGSTPGLLRESLNRVSLLPSEAELIRQKGALPQIATPSARMTLSEAPSELQAELVRELGQEAVRRLGLVGATALATEPVLNFWNRLPARLTLSDRRAKPAPEPRTLGELFKQVRKLAGDPERVAWLESANRLSALARSVGKPGMDELLQGIWFGLTGTAAPDPEAPELLSAIASAASGGAFRGGLSAFRDVLLRLAQRSGAHVPERSEARRVFIEGGRLVGVQLANRGNVIGIRGGILGCSLSQVRDHLSVSGREWPHRLKAAPAPAGWRFTLALTVHAEAIPPGMGNRLIWTEAGAPALEIEVAAPADYGASGEQQRLIFARTVLPFKPESLEPAYLRLVSARVFRQLSELFPFVEYHVARIFPDFRAAGDEEFREAYPFRVPAALPENLRCFADRGVGARAGIEGLFVGTGEAYPELGTLGPVIAAVESAAWIAHKLGVAGPFA